MLQAQQEDSNADLIGSGPRRGPSLEAIERQAVKSKRNGDCFAAMKYFAEVIRLDSSRIGAYKGFADCALEIYLLPEAEKTYRFLAFRDTSRVDGDMLLKLAEVKFILGDYDAARDVYEMIETEPAKFSDAQLRAARKGIRDADQALTAIPRDTTMEVIYLGNTINSDYYAEYSPVFFENRLYYSSYRFPFPKDVHKPQRRLVKIMSVRQGTDTLVTNVEPFNENERHTAHATFSRDGKRMYYGQCDFINDAQIRCQLYVRHRNEDGSWGDAEKLPAPVNLSEFTSTEPSIGWNKKGEETLYFVSDRPGKGLRDIWSVPLEGPGYGELTNLGEINTSGEDVTPGYSSETGTLYFSSDGYEGLGSLDVFKSEGHGKHWSKPENLGSPINTGYNDVFFHLSIPGRAAYFSSNRLRTENFSEEGCCYDLFKVQLAKPEILAVTFHAETRDSLNDTKMRLFRVDKNTGLTLVEEFQEKGNHHRFNLEHNQPYQLIASKPYFSADTVDIAPLSLFDDTTHVYHLFLDPARITLQAHVFQRQRDGSINPCDTTHAEFRDLGPLTRPLPQPAVRFDSLGQPAQNTYTYPLEFNRSYEVFVTKPGFTAGTAKAATDFYTEKDTVIHRDIVLERRMTLVVDIINGVNKKPLMPTILYLDDLQADTSIYEVKMNTNRYVFPVKFGGRYKILGEAMGFYSDSLEFSTPRLGRKPNDTLYQELILYPACLKCYTPITLFYDNDRPFRIDLPGKAVIPQYIDSSKTHYFDLWTSYLQQEEVYIQKHINSRVFTGALREASIDSMHRFFLDSVRGNGEKLNKFMEIMELQLSEHAEIRLIIKGFASPIASSEYNRRLTNRRISALTKWMLEQYRGKLLVKYYKPTPPDKQTLNWDRIANGESESAKNVPDGRSESERKWSVYSVPAAQERKVQVADVIVKYPSKPTYRDAAKVPPRPAIIEQCCGDDF